MSVPSHSHSTARFPEPLAAKVPEITALFWVIKILTTGMGEATSDFLIKINILLGGVVGLAVFVLALWWQFRVRRYIAVVYWLAVAMVAVFGTLAADGLHVELHVPYLGSTIFYAIILAVIFYLWRRNEGTLSIHSIVTRRRETYYWLTVLATFALGTALGDLTAFVLHLGFLTSGLLFTGLILIPALAWWRFGLNEIVAFWWAYVLTRPLGASFADWLGKPHALSGLNLGDGQVAAVATVIIAVLVGYVAVTRNDIQPPLTPVTPPRPSPVSEAEPT
ncbi:MAG TPA: hypothetical protein VFX25_00855 [Streptosporangiaceae bacterium]|nr:hypothetical protein [Streptosporangiaceae bacterium]